MIANFTNFLSNMDKSSQFLLIIIFVIVFLLFLIFIINSINSRKTRRMLKKQKAYKRKLQEEIDIEAKNIVPENISIKPKKEEIVEDIEVLDSENDDIEEIIDDLKSSVNSPNFDLTEFEREQEETAIISYEELCRKHGVPQKIYNKKEETIIKKVNDIVENKVESHTFKPTQYVSPIFGLQKEEDKQEAFLTNLKEFRNGLE